MTSPANAACVQDWSVSDLCDAHDRNAECGLQIFQSGLQSYGGHRRYFGRVVTVGPATGSALSLTSTLEAPGLGQVLMVDGKADPAQALVGDRLAGLAVENGWAGIIVNGYVRDSNALSGFALGIHAWGTRPNKSYTLGELRRGDSFDMAGVRVREGLWVYVDSDGMILATRALGTSSN
jgi:regulator of ribonuclease activity A